MRERGGERDGRRDNGEREKMRGRPGKLYTCKCRERGSKIKNEDENRNVF